MIHSWSAPRGGGVAVVAGHRAALGSAFTGGPWCPWSLPVTRNDNVPDRAARSRLTSQPAMKERCPQGAPRRRRHTAAAAGGVALAAVLVLLACTCFISPTILHVNGLDTTLNDQVGYIATARQLVETGTFQSTIIYPSFLADHASRNYLLHARPLHGAGRDVRPVWVWRLHVHRAQPPVIGCSCASPSS